MKTLPKMEISDEVARQIGEDNKITLKRIREALEQPAESVSPEQFARNRNAMANGR